MNEDSRYSRLTLNYEDDNGHVLFNKFGLKQAGQHGLMDQFLREQPAVRPIAARQLGLMAYQTEYGIYDHINNPDKSRPLALLALHDKENAWEGGPILSMIRRFYTYRIFEQMSLDIFWDLPYPEAMFILEMAEDSIKQRGSAVAQAERDLTREMNKV